jgi:hypothetical protein
MKTMNWISASLVLLASGSIMLAQTERPGRIVPVAQPVMAIAQEHADERAAALDGRALQVFLTLGNTLIVSAADAMPADKYGFASTDGEFKGVRTLVNK